jgi:hypothetical protein
VQSAKYNQTIEVASSAGAKKVVIMADEQNVLMLNPGGNDFDAMGRGDERGVWGGRAAHRGTYTGEWVKDPNNASVPMPANREQYVRETAFSPSARELDVNRYREQGGVLSGRAPINLNYAGANQSLSNAGGALENASGYIGSGKAALSSGHQDRANATQARGLQSQGLDLQWGAATGAAPSRAEVLGRNMIDQSLQAQAAGAAGARGGPLAQIAAQRQVQQGAAGFQAQGMNQLSALRADEMERARAGYMQGASNMRGQDYQGVQSAVGMSGAYGNLGAQQAGVAGQYTGIGQTQAGMAQAQGQMGMQQRALNQAGQLDYERMAWDTNNAAMNSGLARSGLEQQNYWNAKSNDLAEDQLTQQYVAAGLSSAGQMTGSVMNYAAAPKKSQPHGGTTSDMRAKKPVPLLLDMGGRQPEAAAPDWLSQYMNPATRQRDQKHAREQHEERLEEHSAPLGANIERDDPWGSTPGGIQREDPYGSGEVYYSDENAKREAFQEGVLYAEAMGTPKAGEHQAPAYMRGAPPVRQKEMQWGDPKPSTVKAAGRAIPNQPAQQEKRPLLLSHPPSAERIDPKGSQYETRLSPEEESQFQSWKQRFAPNDSGEDYDLRGAFKAGVTPGKDGHWPDTFKKPNHPTFSDESRHATGDNANKAGRWQGGQYIPAASRPKPSAPLPKEMGARPFERGRPVEGPAPKTDHSGSPLASVLQDANRKQAGFPYAYKDEYTPPEQAPGETNYGFSAQELEKNPITATAVKTDPNGMRYVDTHKLQKVQSASIANLQDQVDELKGVRWGQGRPAVDDGVMRWGG